MSDVIKRKAILVAYCLNNLYGCYASLQTFLNFLRMKKQYSRNKIIHKSSHQPSQNLPKRRPKEIPRDLGFDQDRLANGGIIFAPVRKSLRNGKKISACLKKVLKNYALS